MTEVTVSEILEVESEGLELAGEDEGRILEGRDSGESFTKILG